LRQLVLVLDPDVLPARTIFVSEAIELARLQREAFLALSYDVCERKIVLLRYALRVIIVFNLEYKFGSLERQLRELKAQDVSGVVLKRLCLSSRERLRHASGLVNLIY